MKIKSVFHVNLTSSSLDLKFKLDSLGELDVSDVWVHLEFEHWGIFLVIVTPAVVISKDRITVIGKQILLLPILFIFFPRYAKLLFDSEVLSHVGGVHWLKVNFLLIDTVANLIICLRFANIEISWHLDYYNFLILIYNF